MIDSRHLLPELNSSLKDLNNALLFNHTFMIPGSLLLIVGSFKTLQMLKQSQNY